ncbi:MAG: hypothetical protein A2X11_00040 [Bacteroidetes bacterium GWE2_42_24]|nr:MAG: hypothetical protein A2X11_00040 [Bacteroidetes bacterium GWE2_42_24]OFY27805.1 MAG: hypothetical protein A2X09_02855 [Bacteroidetes bacterium GWF2_43_11]
MFIVFFLWMVNDGFGQIGAPDTRGIDAVHQPISGSVPKVSLARAQTSDIFYSRLWLEVDPAVRYIKGEVTHFFKRNIVGDTLYLMLSDSLLVDSIKWHGSHAPFVRPGSDRLLIASIGGLFMPADSLTIFYHGIPPANGSGSFEVGMNGQVPVLWTLSEPYGASDWWPCQNTLNDKTDSIDVSVRCPEGNKVASLGTLQSVETVAGGLIWHWRHRHPVADYLVAFAVTDYAYYEESVPLGIDTLLIANFVYRQDSADCRNQTGDLPEVYSLFTELYGIYPFIDEKYGHAQFGRGGGMEHQTITFIGGFQYEVLVHELAHQWFGDAITCGSWYDLWLNEGWATYSAGLVYERLIGGIYWKPWKTLWRGRVTAVSDGAVQTMDTLNISRLFNERLTYGKAAYVLHMLRWVLTDSLFFEGVRTYLSDDALWMSFVRTDDFRSHMEAASGLDLGVFFDNWLKGEGFPTYTIGWNQAHDTLVIQVHQETSHPSVPFYEMPLPFQVYSSGRDTMLRLLHVGQDQRFMIPFVGNVDSVVFDPDQWLLSGKNKIVGMQSPDTDVNVSVYPNPAHDVFSIILPFPASLTIFDLTGKVVLKRDFLESGVYSIDNKMFSPGVYQVVLCGREKMHTSKLVIL